MYEDQRCEAVQKALLALSDEDREIFYRFYDLAQTAAQIAEAMQMNAPPRPAATAQADTPVPAHSA